jgi:hypothetical protein
MFIARIKPETATEIDFDLNINGTREDPSEFRFVIEANETDGDSKNTFHIICRAHKTETGIKVIIPRLLNIFKSGSHKARLEVVLENRLFVPLEEEVYIEEEVVIEARSTNTPIQDITPVTPEITATLSDNLLAALSGGNQEPKVEESAIEEHIEPEQPVDPFTKPKVSTDTTWRDQGFSGFKNPFKN